AFDGCLEIRVLFEGPDVLKKVCDGMRFPIDWNDDDIGASQVDRNSQKRATTNKKVTTIEIWDKYEVIKMSGDSDFDEEKKRYYEYLDHKSSYHQAHDKIPEVESNKPNTAKFLHLKGREDNARG
nr:hypothetical protein [Tanacetum cinerariifolium]